MSGREDPLIAKVLTAGLLDSVPLYLRGASLGAYLPVLPISDGEGNLSILACAIVQAIITYPEEEDPRQLEWLASGVAKLLVEQPEVFKQEGHGVLAFQVLPHVYSAPSPATLLRNATRDSKNAWIAGELLILLINAAEIHPNQKVTLTKGLSVLLDVLNGKPSWGGGTVQVSQRTGWGAWRRFKSVSHFYAVLQLALQNRDFDLGLSEGEWVVPSWEHLLKFLAFAEYIRGIATRHGLLDPETSWRVPEDIELPEVTLTFPPLPSTALQAIDAYLPEASPDREPIE